MAAALKFRMPPELMLAIAEMEGGKPGQWVRNANGSHDVGPMQFNTKYLAHLQARYGITAADVAASGCYPYELAAWRLRRHLDRDQGDVWTRVANYHSRRPSDNAKYRRKLVRKAASWASWLAAHYRTPERAGPRRGTDKRLQPVHALMRDRLQKRAAERPASTQQESAAPDEESTLLALLGDASIAVDDASRSIGKPHAGALRGAVQVPPHPAYRVLEPARAWGTVSAVRWLVDAFDAMRQAEPTAPLVQVHDMSLRQGGTIHGHRSHQSGRDVDLTYFSRRCRSACGQQALTPETLDAARQWRLLEHWITRNQLEFAFVDYTLQRPLYEHAKAEGATSTQLAHWFQYPRGAGFKGGIVRHVERHADHVHVRFRCSATDDGCGGARAVDASADSWAIELDNTDTTNELLELLE